jgi:hypothetical protein
VGPALDYGELSDRLLAVWPRIAQLLPAVAVTLL